MTGALVLVVGLALLAATGCLIASALRLDGVLELLLGAFVVAACWLVALCLALSVFDRLTRAGLLAGLALGVVAGALVGRRAGRRRLDLRRLGADARAVLSDPIVALLAITVALELAYVVTFTLVVPQADWDALLYHLPRAAAWAREGGIGWIGGVSDPRVNGFAPHAEIAMAATMVLARSDRYVGLVQVASLAAAGAAIALLALRLGATRRAAVFGALVWMTLPVAAVQAPTALNDLALAAPLVAATALALGRSRASLGLAGAATALGFGVKLTAIVVAPLAALVVLAALPRRRALLALAACVGGAALGSYWYVVARIRTGAVDGGVADWQNQVPDRGLGSILSRAGNFAVSFLDASGAAGADRWLFPLTGALLVGAGLVAARGRDRAARLVIVGAIVALAPFVVYAGRIALRHEHRVDDMPLSLVDPMASWYGLAFLVVWPAALVAVLRSDGRTLRRRHAALAAVAAPALFVPIFAVLVVDDGLRGRFFLTPVALAAATFGTVLRWRSVAWATAVLASLTALLSFVHWDDRPMGIRLLAPRVEPALWTAPRWQAQAAHGFPYHAPLIRALEERIPDDATVAAAIGPDEYLYPLYDGRLRRRVVYVPRGDGVPRRAGWLVVGPGGGAGICRDDWATVAAPAAGWRILRRVGATGCAEPTPA